VGYPLLSLTQTVKQENSFSKENNYNHSISLNFELPPALAGGKKLVSNLALAKLYHLAKANNILSHISSSS